MFTHWRTPSAETLAGTRIRLAAIAAVVLLALGCATAVDAPPVDDAPLVEDVIVLDEGASYDFPIGRFAVSRDGMRVVFDEGRLSRIGVYDRETRTLLCTEAHVQALTWDLSEDGRHLMTSEGVYVLPGCDRTTFTEDDPDRQAQNAAFFRNGSGVASVDRFARAVRVRYYDARPDVVVGLEDSAGEFFFFASDRSGRRLLVGTYDGSDATTYVARDHWLVVVSEARAQRLELADVELQSIHGRLRPGVFTDDGSRVRVVTSSGVLEVDVGSGVVTPRPNIPAVLTYDLDDGRIVSLIEDGSTTTFLVDWQGDESPSADFIIGLLDPDGISEPLRADLSGHPRGLEIPRFSATNVGAAPASHEIFLTVPGWPGLLVVPAPIRGAP